MALGKYMRLLLIALDICLLAYIISHMVYRILPVGEPVFWAAVLIEIGLAWLAYKLWMRSRTSSSWNLDKTLTIILVLVAAAWPSLMRYTGSRLLIPATTVDVIFFFAALTFLIYSSFIISPPLNTRKTKP